MDRYEMKFVLTDTSHGVMRTWMRTWTSSKQTYPPRYVNSVYFDTPTFDSAKDNLIGLADRSKYRLRWYSNSSDGIGSSVVVEKKTRNGRLGGKVKWELPDNSFDFRNLSFSNLLSRIEEHSNFRNPFALVPSIQIQYLRHYYQATHGVRITFDEEISFYQVQPQRKLFSTARITYPRKIMELKFPPERKEIVSRGLRNLPLTPRRHSKYLAGLAAFYEVEYV